MTCYELFKQAVKEYDFSTVVKTLNVVSGTAKRWELLEAVPEQYRIDLMKMCHMPIDYSKMTPREKNQFFTKDSTAKDCVELTFSLLMEYVDLTEYIVVEPSAGSGNFLPWLPENTIAMDIESFGNDKILIEDFFDWQPDPDKKYIVIGNPPFGLRGQQALKFINKALTFADFCAFILPPLFNSDGRGTPKKRIDGNLLYSGPCVSNYNYPYGSPVEVETIFQIWTRIKDFGTNVKEKEEPQGFEVYSLSDGGTPGTTRNKDKLYECNYYLPSTCFGVEKIHLYDGFENLPQRRGYGIIVKEKKVNKIIENLDWSKVAFYSTNGASNLRTSLIIHAINTELKNE